MFEKLISKFEEKHLSNIKTYKDFKNGVNISKKERIIMVKIAIDINDTITNSSKVIRKYVMLYQDKYTNDKILTKKLDEVLRGFFNDDAIKEFFKDYACEMANKCKMLKK